MNVRTVILWVLLTLFSPLSSALAVDQRIVDLIGDKDGFGLVSGPDETFDWREVGQLLPGELTDGWKGQNIPTLEWTHAYQLPPSYVITGATLEIFTGGQGDWGPSRVYLDDVFVGELTDGAELGENFSRLDLLDLEPFIYLLDGSDRIRIETVSINGGDDNYVLDYSELTITGYRTTIPLPWMILLLGD